MMRRVTSVVPKNNFILELTFDHGEVRFFDLKPYFRGSLFIPLRDREMFEQVQVSSEPRGLIWPNGAGFCADMSYLNSLPYGQDKDQKLPIEFRPPPDAP